MGRPLRGRPGVSPRILGHAAPWVCIVRVQPVLSSTLMLSLRLRPEGSEVEGASSSSIRLATTPAARRGWARRLRCQPGDHILVGSPCCYVPATASRRRERARAWARSIIADLFRSAIIVTRQPIKPYGNRRGALTAQPPTAGQMLAAHGLPNGGLLVKTFTNSPPGSGCHRPRRGRAPGARAIEPFYGLPGPRQGDRHPLQKRSGVNHLQRRGALPAPRKVSQVARPAGGGLKRLYRPRCNLLLYRDLRDHDFRRLVKCFTNSLPPLGPWRPMTLPGRRPWPLPAPGLVLFAPPGAPFGLRRPVLDGEAGDALDLNCARARARFRFREPH